MNTLTNSVLALIGISAGTALGAALIDSSKPLTAAKSRSLPAINLSNPRNQIVADLETAISAKQKELKDAEQQRAAIASDDTEKLERNQAVITSLTAAIEELESQKGYFSYPAWRAVVNDLLSENNVITFHRFQMFVWTLLLGIIFVIQVYTDLAMPEFDGTLLGLLGISAGTYVGFKLPQERVTTLKTAESK